VNEIAGILAGRAVSP